MIWRLNPVGQQESQSGLLSGSCKAELGPLWRTSAFALGLWWVSEAHPITEVNTVLRVCGSKG
jgi:hypothetical protein